MITIIYDAFVGNPISDALVYNEIGRCMYNNRIKGNFVQTYSTENIFAGFRHLVITGMIVPEDIQFVYGDEIITINTYGVLSNWPDGFCDFIEKNSSIILRLAMNKRHQSGK